MKVMSKTALGLTLYFCSTNFRACILSRVSNLRGQMKLFTISMIEYYKICEIPIQYSREDRSFFQSYQQIAKKQLSKYNVQISMFRQRVFVFLLDILIIIGDLNKYQYRKLILQMDEFFIDGDYNTPQITEYRHPQIQIVNESTQPAFAYQTQQSKLGNFNFASFSGSQPQSTLNQNQQVQNDFEDFQEDENTKRIREQEQRIQKQLRQKSQKQWNDKKERVARGCRQLEEFHARKEQEKQDIAKQNLEKEQKQKKQYNQLKAQEGWHKVISSINVRQGEYKGKKDTNRMREAILHRRQDQSGK